jgi:tryptophanyl-tRNA synthetase
VTHPHERTDHVRQEIIDEFQRASPEERRQAIEEASQRFLERGGFKEELRKKIEETLKDDYNRRLEEELAREKSRLAEQLRSHLRDFRDKLMVEAEQAEEQETRMLEGLKADLAQKRGKLRETLERAREERARLRESLEEKRRAGDQQLRRRK